MIRKLLGLDPSQDVDRIDFAFRGGWFLAVVLIAAALGFAVFLYRSEKLLPRGRRLIMATAQALALLTLVLIVLQPHAVIRMTKESKRFFLVLLDTSRSMEIADPRQSTEQVAEAAHALDLLPLGQSLRGDEAENLKARIGAPTRAALARSGLQHPEIRLVERLAESYQVRPFHFDDALHATTELSPEGLSSNGESSRLGTALEEAISRFAGRPLAGAVVLSDFAWVEGTDPLRVAHQLAQRNIPVYTVPIGLPAPPDLRLTGVVAPEVVFKGDRVPLRVKLESHGYSGRTVDLKLRVDGVETLSQPVTLEEGVQFAELMIVPQQEGGTLDLGFEVAPLEGEVTEINNLTSHQVRVLDEKIRVLYIEGMPRWEYRYLRWVLLRDPRLQVTFLMTQGDPSLAASSPQHIARFPQDPQEALRYDLIIVGDVPASYFNTTQVDLIETLVKERGGSFLMIAGPMAAPATYRETPLGDLLPVRLGTGQSEAVSPEVSPEVTPAGHASLATSLSLSPDTSTRIWSHVKPMHALPSLAGAKPGATVLLRLPRESEAVPEYPLVAWQRVGTGKSLFVATEDLWRMRLEVGDRYHARFWGQTIQFLALSRLLGQNKQVTLETDRAQYHVGEQVRLYANVLTESFEPVELARYEVVLEQDGQAGSSEVIELEPVPDTPGLYTGAALAGTDGRYLVRTTERDSEISNQASFQVRTDPLEDRESAAQEEVAAQVASLSGGRMLAWEDLAALPDTLGPERPIKQVVRIEKDLWDIPLWFLLVAAFAGTEWYLRRKDNLV